METPWFELHPDRYRKELDALTGLKIKSSEDPLMKNNGILRLHLTIEGNNPNFDLPAKESVYSLDAVFPDSYPWFRPEVYAYELNLPRHQHLRGKNLCLLNRSTAEWDPTETLAGLLKEQLAEVLQKGAISNYEVIKQDQREQAEPYSDYYSVRLNAPVLFDSSIIPDRGPSSVINEIGKIDVGLPKDWEFPGRLAVLNIRLENNSTPYGVNKEIAKLFSYKRVQGVLIEAPSHPPITNDPNDVLNWLKIELSKVGKKLRLPRANVRVHNGGIDTVVGISFPEEIRKGTSGQGWIFLIIGSFRESIEKKAIPKLYLAKAAYIGPAISKERVPNLLPLSSKTVSLCGLGALGSFIALELARCGIRELRLLDYDIVDPPTTVRWPLGISAAGLDKTTALLNFIKSNYPLTNVVLVNHRIGGNRVEGNTPLNELAITDNMAVDLLLKDSDMVIDATAEEGVTNFLTRIAVRRKLPHIVLYATPGAWGGVLMRWMPGVTEGCWNCMRHWQFENPESLVPPADDEGLIQPPGCADITFTGTSFDLQQISSAGVRMAVSMLCSSDGGYPLIQNDWGVLKLFNEGKAIFPSWLDKKLLRHTKCGYCAKK